MPDFSSMFPGSPYLAEGNSSTVLGKVKPTIILNDPEHVHYGPRDPVKGRVSLRYYGGTYTPFEFDLDAPCEITVYFSGNLKVQFVPAKSDVGAPDFFSSNTAVLFCQSHCVLNDWTGSMANQNRQETHGPKPNGGARDFPFEFRFPERIEYNDCFERAWGEGETQGAITKSGKFESDPDQPLPPSMMFRRKSRSRHDATEISVQYALKVFVHMPGTPVATFHSHEVNVLYDRERAHDRSKALGPPLVLGNLQSCFGTLGSPCVTTGRRISAATLRQSLRARMDSVSRGGLSSAPSDRPSLTWHLTSPKEVHRGQPLNLQVQLEQPSVSSTEQHSERTAIIPAEVELSEMTVTVEAVTDAQGEVDRRFMVNHKPRPGQQYTNRHVVATETVDLSKIATPHVEINSDAGRKDSSKDDVDVARLHAGNGWSRVVSLPDITKNLTSSFSTICIRQSYSFTVRCQVKILGSRRTEVFEHPFPVEVLPPMFHADSDTADPSVSEMPGDQPIRELDSGAPLQTRAELGPLTERKLLPELEGSLHDMGRTELDAGASRVTAVKLHANMRPAADA